MRSALTLHDLTLTWPDGTAVLDSLDLDLGSGRHGLVGANGSGKSTLLRLMSGELQPVRGSRHALGTVARLPQDPLRGNERSVADVLGISDVRSALRAIESGSTDVAHFEALGDGWDIEERAGAELHRLGLGRLDLDRPIDAVSGGELVLLALGARLLTSPAVLLLDEPTNNLDRVARKRLHEVVAGFAGVLVIASHDRELLEVMDTTHELRDGRVRTFGGGFSVYEEAVAAEQETARRHVRDAESDLRRQRRELADAQVTLARRRRYGQKMFEEKRAPKVVMGTRKRAAQVSAGKLRGRMESEVGAARDRLAEAAASVRDDREISFDLPATRVPGARVVLTTDDLHLVHTGARVDLAVQGPERIGIVGPNGSGKTTLLRTIVGEVAPASGEIMLRVPARHLPQQMTVLDDDLSIVENVRRHAPGTSEQAVRAQLARLLFRGRAADQLARTLSGGERLRATVACLLLAEPAPQLLLLDEPTNNLDLRGVQHLVGALRSYEGALVVVSHDDRFLDEVGVERAVELVRSVT